MSAGERSGVVALRARARSSVAYAFVDQLPDVIGVVEEADLLGDVEVRGTGLGRFDHRVEEVVGRAPRCFGGGVQLGLHLVLHAFQDPMSESLIPILYRAS